jgi:hypothetical protein
VDRFSIHEPELASVEGYHSTREAELDAVAWSSGLSERCCA